MVQPLTMDKQDKALLIAKVLDWHRAAEAYCCIVADILLTVPSLSTEIASRQSRAPAASSVQVWYSVYFGAAAFVAPFINLYLFKQGYSSSQIGVLAAAKPWLGAVAGASLCSLADVLRRHR